ncbi:MAG: alpha/beta hydrolase, partial [Lachnospiraceae bacterium]|nr:alpha/beta hydrolase [Lachnospiraceae bacterium]
PARLRPGVPSASAVSQEEWDRDPATVRELAVSTSQGDARVYAVSAKTATESKPLILNFHGGGFIGKHMDRDELFCRKMAKRFDALVLDVDYRLAPENPYPAAVLECWDVAKWAYENCAALGADPSKIILTGHSSGGNLAAGICMRAGQTGAFRPLCAVIDYAPLDLMTDPADKKQSICDMPAERAQAYNAKYIAPEKAEDPFVSPVYADPALLEHFPATLVISAGEDRLCEENELFAMKLAKAGVVVTSKRFTESIHGFVINRMCEWEQATELIFTFIAQRLRGE